MVNVHHVRRLRCHGNRVCLLGHHQRFICGSLWSDSVFTKKWVNFQFVAVLVLLNLRRYWIRTYKSEKHGILDGTAISMCTRWHAFGGEFSGCTLVERKVRSARVFNQIRPCSFSRVLRQDLATIGYILHLNNTNVAKNEVQSLLYYVDV